MSLKFEDTQAIKANCPFYGTTLYPEMSSWCVLFSLDQERYTNFLRGAFGKYVARSFISVTN